MNIQQRGSAKLEKKSAKRALRRASTITALLIFTLYSTSLMATDHFPGIKDTFVSSSSWCIHPRKLAYWWLQHATDQQHILTKTNAASKDVNVTRSLIVTKALSQSSNCIAKFSYDGVSFRCNEQFKVHCSLVGLASVMIARSV